MGTRWIGPLHPVQRTTVQKHMADLVAPSEPVAATVIGHALVNIFPNQQYPPKRIDRSMPLAHRKTGHDIALTYGCYRAETEFDQDGINL